MGDISKHFSFSEFAEHDGVAVPGACRPAVRDLCIEWLEPIRHHFGATRIISGYRSAAYNRRIGGAHHSFHIYDAHPGCAAADFSAATGTPAEWYAFLDARRAPGLGKYDAHVHVDTRPWKARW